MKRLRFVVLATGVALGVGLLTAVPASAAVAPAAPAIHAATVAQPPPPGPYCYYRNARIWGGEAQWQVCRNWNQVEVRGWVADTQWDRQCAIATVAFDNGQRYWARSCQPGYRQFFDFRGWGRDAWVQLSLDWGGPGGMH